MFAKRYGPNELIDILSAPSYCPEIISYVQKVEESPRLSQFLSQKPKLGITGTIAKDYVTPDVPQAIPYVSTKQVKGLHAYIDDAKYISKEADIEWAKCRVDDGDIIINKSGNVGAAAVLCCSPYPYASSVSDIINIKIAKHAAIDRDYLVVYLNSPYGQKQLQRLSGGAIFSHVSLHAIPDIRIYDVELIAQKYIGEKVRQAERLRAWAKDLQLQIKQQFEFLVKQKPSASKYSWTSPLDLEPYRINPGHYDPVVLSLLKRASSEGVKLEPISALLGNRKIAGGATPKGADYLGSGVLFGRVQNVKPLALDLSDAVFIDADTNEQLSRSECQVDDIVLSITGYPGTASLVTEQDLPMNINQHSVRFNIKQGVDSAYVCAALNSEFLKLQVQRLSIGGTRDALDFPSVGNLLIPRLNEDIESVVAVSARHYIKAVQLSKLLTFVAKTLIEELIEGNISEAELVSAQQALEAGDESLDRVLLERMTAEGIDGEGDPLFDDIDQLYDLLEQAKQALDADDTMAEV